jgi:malate permease and related proteins
MLAAVSSVLTLFLLIGTGFALARKGILGPEASRTFVWLVMNLALPSMMLSQLVGSFTRRELLGAGRGLAIPFLALGATFLLAWLAARFVAVGRRGTFIAMVTTTNAIFVGMPVNLALFGPGAVPGVLFFYAANTAFFWTLGAHGIESDAGRHLPLLSREHLGRILLSPPFMAMLTGMALVLLELRLPDFLMNTLKHFGALTSPLSLLFMGITFAGVSLAELRPTREMLLLFAGRFLLAPGLIYLACRLLPVPPLLAKVFMIQAAMPAITQAALVARHMEADYHYATVQVTATNLASLAILPLYMGLFSVLFPG